MASASSLGKKKKKQQTPKRLFIKILSFVKSYLFTIWTMMLFFFSFLLVLPKLQHLSDIRDKLKM